MGGVNRNQTALTERVTATAMAFLDGLYCRPVETEVGVASGWVADIGAVMTHTVTANKKLHLDERFKEDIKDSELYRGWKMYEYYGGVTTIIVEVKTSRADFLKDVKGKFSRRAPVHLSFIAYPQGLIKEDEIPGGWGAIATSKNGERIYRRPVHPRYRAVHPGELNGFLLEIARRTDARTRYQWNREVMKRYRANDAEMKRTGTARTVMTMLIKWAKGEQDKIWEGSTLKEALGYCGVKVDDYMAREIEAFEKMFPKPRGGK